MIAIDLAGIREKHRLWLAGEPGGKRADLSGANLNWANLSGASLNWANLSGASLRGANLRRADLSGANLSGADLSGANLSRANLSQADLRRADLRRADLSGADLDFAAWPLWCGSRNVRVDVRLAQQLAAHFCALICDDAEYEAARQSILPFARLSHIASDLYILR